jgi:hypothetical protein
LVTAEFLFQERTRPQASYRFKHALIQEAAYQSLLKSVRHAHHRRIANTLSADFPDVVSAHPELLAHHFTAAGLSDQAIPYWLSAARLALQRYANHEAIGHADPWPRTSELCSRQRSVTNRNFPCSWCWGLRGVLSQVPTPARTPSPAPERSDGASAPAL